MKLVVGLGNPGNEYKNTRHNVGFIILDNYCKDSLWKEDSNCLLQSKIINNEKVLFIKPTTFMNLSGKAVSKIVNFYKILPENILVIHDDLDLPIGKFRLKKSSSAGGHNGIKNIIECLGYNTFNHLKIGIGNNKIIDTRDYVLGKLSAAEIEVLNSNKYIEIINYFLNNNIEKTMNKFNSNGE